MVMTFHRSFRVLPGGILVFVVSVLMGGWMYSTCGNPSQPSEGADHPGTFYTIEKKYANSEVDGYNMYVPPSYSTHSKAFPLIVFFQGGLGVGGKVNAIFNWALPKELKETKELDSEIDQLKLNTFVYVMPHISHGEFYNNVAAIRQLLDEVIATYNIDENRIYLTGLSKGGHGTWGVASEIPDRFAAIAPIAGAAHGVHYYEALTDLPIWAAHNLDDETVSHFRTENTVRKIEKLSGKKFHRTQTVAEADYLHHDQIFTSGKNITDKHDAWTEIYNEVNFYKWLLRFDAQKVWPGQK